MIKLAITLQRHSNTPYVVNKAVASRVGGGGSSGGIQIPHKWLGDTAVGAPPPNDLPNYIPLLETPLSKYLSDSVRCAEELLHDDRYSFQRNSLTITVRRGQV